MKSKVKYSYMTKDKKRKVREEYAKTEDGKRQLRVLNRLFVEAILCIVCGVAMLVYAITSKNEWHYYALAITLLVAGIGFFIADIVIRGLHYDKFANDNLKKFK